MSSSSFPITNLIFRLVPIQGEIGTATGANPSGFVGKSFYYEIIKGSWESNALAGGIAPYPQGQVIGVITYDYFQSRWAVLFTVDGALNPNTDNGQPITGGKSYTNDILALQNFLTAIQSAPWPQPVTQDAIGDLYPYQASFPPIKS